MRLSLFLSIPLIIAATQSQAFFPGMERQPCDNVPPPHQFDAPVLVNVHKWVTAPEDMQRLCKLPGSADQTIYGCWVPDAPAPGATRSFSVQIYLNKLMDAAETKCTLRHELAELPPNNWPDPQDLSPAIRNQGTSR